MMKFRPVQCGRQEQKNELVKALPKAGDTVRVLGNPQEYVVDSAGMKLFKLHAKDNPLKKLTAFKKDCVKIFND